MDIVNWINSNSGFITAIATVILASATLYYAFTNHKLWWAMERNLKNRQRSDEINFVIKPFIDQCNTELNLLNNEAYWDTPSEKILLKKFHVKGIIKTILNNVLKENPTLKKAVKDHDKIIFDLEENYENAKSSVKSEDFYSKLDKFTEEFNQKSTEKVSTDRTHSSKIIITHIFKNTDVNENSLGSSFKSFWKLYGKFFLDMRSQGELKEYLNAMQSLSNQLKEKNEFIIENLGEIWSTYITKYGLSLDEIEDKNTLKGDGYY